MKSSISYLKSEIIHTLNKEEYTIKTIYIGGGTPSSIDSQLIVDLIGTIQNTSKNFSPCEITIEVNPRNHYRKEIVGLSKSKNQPIKYRTSRNE